MAAVEYRRGILDQFSILDREKKRLGTELAMLREAAVPILKMANPTEEVATGPCACLEGMRAAPTKLRSFVKSVAMESTLQPLVTLKSHYPLIEVERAGEGVALGSTDEEVLALHEEVKPTANVLVGNLNLGPLWSKSD